MEEESSGPSFGMRIVAALVLALAAWFLLKVIIGIVAGVAWFVRSWSRSSPSSGLHARCSEPRQVPPCPS